MIMKRLLILIGVLSLTQIACPQLATVNNQEPMESVRQKINATITRVNVLNTNTVRYTDAQYIPLTWNDVVNKLSISSFNTFSNNIYSQINSNTLTQGNTNTTLQSQITTLNNRTNVWNTVTNKADQSNLTAIETRTNTWNDVTNKASQTYVTNALNTKLNSNGGTATNLSVVGQIQHSDNFNSWWKAGLYYSTYAFQFGSDGISYNDYLILHGSGYIEAPNASDPDSGNSYLLNKGANDLLYIKASQLTATVTTNANEVVSNAGLTAALNNKANLTDFNSLTSRVSTLENTKLILTEDTRFVEETGGVSLETRLGTNWIKQTTWKTPLTVTVTNTASAFDGDYVYDEDESKWLKSTTHSLFKDGATWKLTDGVTTYTAADNGLNTPPATFTATTDLVDQVLVVGSGIPELDGLYDFSPRYEGDVYYLVLGKGSVSQSFITDAFGSDKYSNAIIETPPKADGWVVFGTGLEPAPTLEYSLEATATVSYSYGADLRHDALVEEVDTHIANTNNPHTVTAEQIGLGNGISTNLLVLGVSGTTNTLQIVNGIIIGVNQ